jgi:regulator of sirC expression with transglutaminase-like and TPR domain
MVTPTERFARLVQGQEGDLPLDEAAILLAAHGEPGLDVDAQLARLDGLASQVDQPSADAVVALLFAELGLRGNREDYSDPRNSFLDQVLDRRLGIPISLAVLMMEVGRRVGLRFEGIGMPGHFLVRSDDVFLDPYHGGQMLDVEGCQALFHRLHGPAAPFSPALLTPNGPRAILARMLANLRHSYAARRDTAALAWVLRLRVAIPGVPQTELADLAQVLVSMGRFAEAAAALDQLADSGELSEEDAATIRGQALAWRARLN